VGVHNPPGHPLEPPLLGWRKRSSRIDRLGYLQVDTGYHVLDGLFQQSIDNGRRLQQAEPTADNVQYIDNCMFISLQTYDRLIATATSANFFPAYYEQMCIMHNAKYSLSQL